MWFCAGQFVSRGLWRCGEKMSRSELIESYRALVERYDVIRQRKEKASQQRNKFRASVVERVIRDYENQLAELEKELVPLEEKVAEQVKALEQERHQVDVEKNGIDERMEELELRNLLGEFDEAEFEKRSKEVEGERENYAARLAELDEQLGEYKALLEKSGANERLAGRSAKAVSEPAAASAHADKAPVSAVPPAASSHQAAPALGADPTAFSGTQAPPQGGQGAFDQIFDDFPIGNESNIPDDMQGGAEGGMDDLQKLTEFDAGWNASGGEDFSAGGQFESGLSEGAPGALSEDFSRLDFPDASGADAGAGVEAAPKAFLIRHFNRPDEDRYEISDSVTSIGRGRDNQIQIKDDTKVSRYHCRILHEPTGYYVEDNNSSNGTMVNGELITRKKIEGGEEVTIGETVFRFVVG